ncbi:hypothetical protein [Paraflavitalea pollutisoli]|uniref:hypothetical protein n=1 Tax=Paraflavitalea pollutisoli TaxID=3034143 RepID=UPI0023EB5DF5|nr:hypothetical protein [Paraflavitalea sp. H1-2-19X]
MPVPILLKDQHSIVFAIEDNAGANFKPYIIHNSIPENWQQTIGADDPHRQYALAEKVEEVTYAGAPYLRQLSTGETILSYQGTEGRTHKMENAEMKVVIGNAAAGQFTSKSSPFPIPPNKNGLWNSLCILDDDTIIALTSTNAYGPRTEVWMIKGRLQRGGKSH